MENLGFQLFCKEYGRIVNVENKYLDVSIENDTIILRSKTANGALRIACKNEDESYDGKVEVRLDNNQFHDYNESMIEFGFPECLSGIAKYFNLKCKIEICADNVYILTIGGPDMDGMNLITSTTMDNYFKDVDMYMTDINLRKSNVVSSVEKLRWYFSSLNYMQVVGKSKINKIKPYNLVVSSMIINKKTMDAVHEEISEPIVILDTIEFRDCELENDGLEFCEIARGVKILK